MAFSSSKKAVSLLWALVVSFVLSGILLLLLSFLLYRLRFSDSQLRAGVYVIYGISCLAGGFFSGKRIRLRRFIWGALTGILYFAFLFAISLLINQGIHSGIPGILISLLICTGSGTVGGMIS